MSVLGGVWQKCFHSLLLNAVSLSKVTAVNMERSTADISGSGCVNWCYVVASIWRGALLIDVSGSGCVNWCYIVAAIWRGALLIYQAVVV